MTSVTPGHCQEPGGGNSGILPLKVSHLSQGGGGVLLVMSLFSDLYEIAPNYPTISCIKQVLGI